MLAVPSAALLVVALGLAAPAAAFPPTNLKSLGGDSHERITKRVFDDLAAEFFGIGKPTGTMRSARTRIVDENVDVDSNQYYSAPHFDGENFAGGQSRLIFLADMVVEDLQADEAPAARVALGAALHTVQDFYAHSNWIELGHTGANPDLGRAGHTLGTVAGPTEPTCIGSTLLTEKLTSGYYGGEDRKPEIDTKCRHGGPFDKGPGTGGINKDLASPIFSPHATMNSAAANAATEATKQYLRDLKDRLTEDQLKDLFGVGPTLGIAIDTTGSMGDTIEAVKAAAMGIVDRRAGTDEEPSRYVLVPFNDPSVGPAFSTGDPAVFKAAIASLSADGGGDCPELSMSGTLQTITRVGRDGDVYLFTDAASKDAALADNVVGAARSAGTRLFPLIFGDCEPEGESARASQQPAARGRTALADATIDPTYSTVAERTGGQAFRLSVTDAGSITGLTDLLMRSNEVTVLNTKVSLAPAPGRNLDVPVDSTMTNVVFSVSGAAANALTTTVTRPDGTVVRASDPDVTNVAVSSESAPATVLGVQHPAPGHWTVTVDGSGTASVRATGESTLDLSSFRFLTTESVDPHPSAKGVQRLPGSPPASRPVGADATLTDGFATTQFSLRSLDGAPKQSLTLAKQDNEFTGQVTLAPGPAILYVTGKDHAGTDYQRVSPAVIEPQTLEVVPPPAGELLAGRTQTFPFTVHNIGASGTFALTAADDHGFLQSTAPQTLHLAEGATAEVEVVVQAAPATPVGTPDTITVAARSTTDPSVQNSAVLSATVTDIVADSTPPSTTAGSKPLPNAAGWYNHDVTIRLNATDAPGGSGVASLTYSATGARAIPPTTVHGSSASIRVRTEGATTLSYAATDAAGNVETTKYLTIRLDRTPPRVSCNVSPRRIWPPQRQMVPVHTNVTVGDRLSGPDGFLLAGVSANQRIGRHDITGFQVGAADLSGRLRAARNTRTAARLYTIWYAGADIANNTATCSVQVIVAPPHH